MSVAQAGIVKFKEYAGSFIDLGEIAVLTPNGQVVLKSGFNITGLSDDAFLRLCQDKQAYESTIEQAEAARQRAEAVRVENEKQRVTEFSVIMNNLGGIQSSEASRQTAEQARVIAEQARVIAETDRDDAESTRVAFANKLAAAGS